MKKKPLSPKERKFIKRYIETGNGALAVEGAYDVKNRENAYNMAKQLKKKPRIKEAIDQALIKAGLTPDYFADSLIESIEKGKQGKPALSDALRGLDIYAKVQALYNPEKLEESYKTTIRRLPTKELIVELEKRKSVSTQLLEELKTY